MSETLDYKWVRVGDGDPEPAAITGEKPNRKATTLGCPDTFDVDDPNSGCAIVLLAPQHVDPRDGRVREAYLDFDEDWGSNSHFQEVDRQTAEAREKAYRKAIKVKPHSYAGFGRRAW